MALHRALPRSNRHRSWPNGSPPRPKRTVAAAADGSTSSQPQPADPTPASPPTGSVPFLIVRQVLQLSTVLGLLILLPAYAFRVLYALPVGWWLFYCIFFLVSERRQVPLVRVKKICHYPSIRTEHFDRTSIRIRLRAFFIAQRLPSQAGTVRRIIVHGPLSPRAKDRQRTSSLASRAALALFIVAIPALHIAATLSLAAFGPPSQLKQVAACSLAGLALYLNVLAAGSLGKSYDRVVVQEALVTSGVYGHARHPIYG